MPFLVPAVASGVSDALILVLSVHLQHEDSRYHEALSQSLALEGGNSEEAVSVNAHAIVHHVHYLTLAAIVRLLILLLPFPYHSYTGSAIRFCSCYYLFYGLTLFAALVHMLALSMADPESLSSLFSASNTGHSYFTGTSNSDSNSSTTTIPFSFALLSQIEEQHASQACWWILLLTVVSVISHFVMLIHVRSTGPSISYARYPYGPLRNQKKRMVYYYASQHKKARASPAGSGNKGDARNGTTQTAAAAAATVAATLNGENGNQKPKRESIGLPPRSNGGLSVNTKPDEEAPVSNELEPVTPARFSPNATESQSSTARKKFPASPMKKLTSHYDEFLSDFHSRIKLLKQDWSHKLDDFTQRHLNLSNNLNVTNRMIQHHQHNNPLLPLTPFRVLLQLFAYEDVIDSGKLDAVFEMDQGQSMTFFVPQLLSFLLHGAYYESDPTKLEAWILDKCSKHIHFAHRCYWFLRAWSLEQQNPVWAPEPIVNSDVTTILSPKPSWTSPLSSTNLRKSNDNFASETSTCYPRTFSNGNGRRPSRSNSSSSLPGALSDSALDTNISKLLPEERAVIEDLMLRVIKSGEAPARILNFGHPRKSPVNNSIKKKSRRGKRDKSSLMRKNSDDGLPDNQSNCDTEESSVNLSLSSPKQSAVEPQGIFWDEGGVSPACSLVPELQLTPEMEASLPVDPMTGYPSTRHVETLTAANRFGFLPAEEAKQQQQITSNSGSSTSDSFMATPNFMDSLLAMADSLFLVPREQRKAQLRLQLENLEIEMLPSNAIYIPLSDSYHRVWRIVADESIALNTKERVPCIVLLEVVDYKGYSSTDSDNDEISTDTGGINLFPEPVSSKKPRAKRSVEMPQLRPLKLKRKPGKAKLDEGDTNDESDGDDGFDGFQPMSPSNSLNTSMLPLPFANHPYGGMSEQDIVNQWRFGWRDPHRGESILDKMTNSIPLDFLKVKKKMIHQLRGKQDALQELFSLTTPDNRSGRSVNSWTENENGIGREKDSEMAAFLCMESGEGSRIFREPATDNRDNECQEGNGSSCSRDLSPERSAPEEMMGQWGSPITKRPVVSLSNPPSEQTSAYGSTYEGRGLVREQSPQLRSRSRANSTEKYSGEFLSGTGTMTAKKTTQQVVFQENWQAKEDRLRPKSAFGRHPGWRLLPVLVKANDDLRQEQLASQLIKRMAFILARERVPVWLCPYEILAITDRGGVVEAIPDTISLDSLKRNDPNFVDLKTFFHSYFGDNIDDLADAKANFVESLAAYSVVTYLLQIKDRHNGNILLDNRGHIIHIDFGFFFLSSPGRNTGFESAPFKLTKDFVDVMGGPDSHAFKTFSELCVRSFIVLRRHCMEIILLVEMLKAGNEDLPCFCGRPDDAIKGVRERFRLDLSDRACREYVLSLIDESLENWRTNWYDRYQRYCVGVL